MDWYIWVCFVFQIRDIDRKLEVYREVRDDLELRIMELLRRMEPSLA
jgi:hypothetical protein